LKLPESKLFKLSSVLRGPYCYVSPNSKRALGEVAECFEESKFVPPTCPNWPDRHSVLTPEPETRDLYAYNRSRSDLMWHPGICLVKTEHIARIDKHGFTGIDFRKVNLSSDAKCTKPLEGYSEMRVIGRVPIDMERSGVRVKFACPICGEKMYSHWDRNLGLHFEGNEDEWPDVFMMEPWITSFILVKPAFAQLMVDLKLRPVALKRFEDIRV